MNQLDDVAPGDSLDDDTVQLDRTAAACAWLLPVAEAADAAGVAAWLRAVQSAAEAERARLVQ